MSKQLKKVPSNDWQLLGETFGDMLLVLELYFAGFAGPVQCFIDSKCFPLVLIRRSKGSGPRSPQAYFLLIFLLIVL